MCGSICGGVISRSQCEKEIKKYGVWANAMAFVMPDKHFKRYLTFKKSGKEKQAQKVFKRWAISQI